MFQSGHMHLHPCAKQFEEGLLLRHDLENERKSSAWGQYTNETPLGSQSKADGQRA